MKKIKLSLDDLKVESFETTPSREGDVYGYSCPTCGAPTCAQTCPATCAATCANTCPATDCSCPIRACLESSGGFPCN